VALARKTGGIGLIGALDPKGTNHKRWGQTQFERAHLWEFLRPRHVGTPASARCFVFDGRRKKKKGRGKGVGPPVAPWRARALIEGACAPATVRVFLQLDLGARASKQRVAAACFDFSRGD